MLRRYGWLSSARRVLQRPGRRHEGRVAVAEPNRRWASDITSLTSWDGTTLRLVVWLDCANRSVLACRTPIRSPQSNGLAEAFLWNAKVQGGVVLK